MKESLVKYLKQSKMIGLNKKVEAMATIPLHGPSVTADEVLAMLLDKQDHLQSSIIHLDIPQRVKNPEWLKDEQHFSAIFVLYNCRL